MDLQKKIKKQFLKYKTIIIKQVGKKAMYNDTLDKICKGLFKSRYIGTYLLDKVPIKKYPSTSYFIINTSKSNEDGEHWIALVLHGSNAYIYDSFGRKSENIIKSLTNILNKKKIHYYDSNHDAEQHGYNSEICGQLCVSWLICYDKFGSDSALLI